MSLTTSIAPRTQLIVAILLLCVWAAASTGFAAIMQSDTTVNGDDVSIAVSAVDLINQPSSTVSSTGYAAFNNGTTTSDDDNLNNGTQGITGVTPGNVALATVAFDLDGTWTSTFALPASPFGYDITQIDTIGGWIDSRSGQTYELLFSFVGNAGFTSQGTFTIADPGTGSTRIRLTDDDTGIIATGVDSVQFSFTPTTTQDVYREIDVFGIPSIPEPASSVLWVLGAVGMYLTARRRRKA